MINMAKATATTTETNPVPECPTTKAVFAVKYFCPRGDHQYEEYFYEDSPFIHIVERTVCPKCFTPLKYNKKKL